MGFPLSTFQQLSRLCQEEPEIRSVFNEFKLIGIIIHDPNDEEFRRHIKYSFEDLHEVTGVNFAFITFINPPYRWAMTHRHWMEVRERISAGDGCEDAEFVLVLQRRLELPDRPCLILTDNLLSNKYVILPTSRTEIIQQMEAIAEYSNSQSDRFPVSDHNFLSLLSRLGPAFDEQTKDGNSLAKNIADLIAVRALNGLGTIDDKYAIRIQKNEARDYVRHELLTLWNQLEEERQNDDAGNSQDRLDRFSDYLAFILGTPSSRLVRSMHEMRQEISPIRSNSLYSEYTLFERDLERMESISKTYLSNYNRLLPIYFGNNDVNPFFGKDIDFLNPSLFNTDYSPLGNYLGKAMEEEINASIVQQARYIMGVHMPEFYRRYEESLNDRCEIRTKQKNIFLNWRGKQLSASVFEDRSLPMGEAVCVIRKFIEDNPTRAEKDLSVGNGFIERVDQFSRLRNRVCHSGLFSHNEFDSMFNGFREVLRYDMPIMFHIKKSLRSERIADSLLFDDSISESDWE